MDMVISGRARLLGDNINTDINCSSKYMPGRDDAYIAAHAFEQAAPGFAATLKAGDIIVAGRNFGINSSREQAARVIRMMGAAAVVARSFGRQFYRNAINNGLPLIECDTAGIAEGEEIAVDLTAGRVTLPGGVVRQGKPLPGEILAMLSSGGLIPFLEQHPDWKPA